MRKKNPASINEYNGVDYNLKLKEFDPLSTPPGSAVFIDPLDLTNLKVLKNSLNLANVQNLLK